jgi:membrane-bound lytic murein transglycosylase D
MFKLSKNITLLRRLFTLFLCLAFFFIPATVPAKKAPRFPVYPVIQANVKFWEDVYGTYSSHQGILHDKHNLAIVYGVVDLVSWNTPGAARINKKLIKMARHRYKNILNDLGHGRKARTKEGKRIAALCPKSRHSNFLKAKDNIRLQIGQKDHFRQGVIRSGAYIPRIQAIFKAHNLPLELAYLPHVESSFNPKAHSKAGAVGLWQFTRDTGKNYMTIDSVLDERYDPQLASHAAAKLLKENYRQLGSWPLALTAYNYGRAGMVRALRQQKTYENIYKYHKTKIFKFAARNFYSEFIAAYRVARRLEKDPSLIQDRPAAGITLRMDDFAEPGGVRRYFKLSRKDFARLNPALREPVLKGKKIYP